jgi:hypothetical protein
MKKTVLLIAAVIFSFMCANAYADHLIVYDDNNDLVWGGNNVGESGGGPWWESNRVYIGTGAVEGLKYEVQPNDGQPKPCTCQGSDHPMSHGKTIHIATHDESKVWEWTAKDGNDKPEDFYRWWNEEGPGKDGYDIDHLLQQHYAVADLMSGTGNGDLAASAAGPAGRTTRLFFQSVVMPTATTRAQKKAAAAGLTRMPRTIGGTFRYENIDFENFEEGDGDIYGTNLGFDWSMDNITVGMLVPYDYLALDFANGNRIGTVLYGRYDYHITDMLTVAGSANFNYMYTDMNTGGDDDSVNMYGGGVGLSLTYDADTFIPSFGFAYQYSQDDSDYDDDYQHLVKLGFNLGTRIGEHAVVNIFTVWNYDVTSYDIDTDDDNYFDMGAEVNWNITDAWGFNIGYKKVADLDDYDSNQFYLGTIWKF